MTAAADSVGRRTILDDINFHEAFQEFLDMGQRDKQTEHFADLAPDELEELTNIQVEAASLDETFKLAMRAHTDALCALNGRKKAFWDKVEVQLKDQWPEDHAVLAKPDGKLYRTPANG